MKEQIISLRVIKSFRFLSSSVGKLAEYPIIHRIISDNDADKLELLLRNSVYPYQNTLSLHKLRET